MHWFKKHADSIAVIAAIAIGVYVMKHDIHSLDEKLSNRIYEGDEKLSKQMLDADERLIRQLHETDAALSRDIAQVNNEIIKIQTVLIIKGLVPTDIFATNEKDAK